LWKR